MTGYTVFIAAEDLIPLDMTVEEAFRLVLSVGVLVPDRHLKAGHAKALPGPGKAKGGPED
jgi:uncharacterized membrane protein